MYKGLAELQKVPPAMAWLAAIIHLMRPGEKKISVAEKIL